MVPEFPLHQPVSSGTHEKPPPGGFDDVNRRA